MTKGAIRRYNKKLGDLFRTNSILRSEVSLLKDQLRGMESLKLKAKKETQELQQVRVQLTEMSDRVVNLGRKLRKVRKEES